MLYVLLTECGLGSKQQHLRKRSISVRSITDSYLSPGRKNQPIVEVLFICPIFCVF